MRRHLRPLLCLYGTFGIYFTLLFSRMLEKKDSGLWAGHVNVWSDWSLHLAITNLFSSKPLSEWFLYHPYFAHGKFTYPFLTNLIPALWVKFFGLNLTTALWLSSLIYSLVLLGALYALGVTLIRKPQGRWISVAGISLFLFSSGPGFLYALKDFFKKTTTIDFLLYPTRDYSRIDSFQWYAGNVITGLLAPQRGFLLGMTLGAIGFFLFLRALEKNSSKLFLVSAVFIGLLPITHMHTLFALSPALALICVYHHQRWKKLLWFVIPSTVLVFGLYFLFISGGIQNSKFMNLAVGYSSQWNTPPETGLIESIRRFFWLWFRIWGFFLPIYFWAFTRYILDRDNPFSSKAFFLGHFFMFILGNLILFQPVAWDNSKIFFWMYFSGCLLIAKWLIENFQPKKHFSAAIVATLFFSISATGIWELWRLIQIPKHQFMMTNSEDMALGERIKAETPSNAVFMTASEHNHWVMLWGTRSILLGFTPWVWNYGFLYNERERDLKQMYEAPESNTTLFDKYQISYVVIGPSERYHFKVNEKYFSENWKLKFQNAQNLVYSR